MRVWGYIAVAGGAVVLARLRITALGVFFFGLIGFVIVELLGWLKAQKERRRLSGKIPVYDMRDPEGRLISFEVDNTYLGRRGVSKIVATIPGARILRWPRYPFSWWREEEFCEWELDGVIFQASEPFGDNSRYLIHSVMPTGWIPQIERVRDAFARADLE